MATPAVYFNGIDTKALGFRITDTPRFPTPPTRRVTVVPVANRMGGVATMVTYDPRTLPIHGVILGTDAGNRETLEDVLKDLAHSGEVTCRVDNGSTAPREIRGLLNGDAPIEVYRPALTPHSKTSQATIPLLCPIPLWQLPEPVTRAVETANTPVALSLGTATSDPIIRVRGTSGGAAIVITVKDSAGRPVQSLTVPALTANDWYQLDMGTGIITKSLAGVLTVDQALYTAGVFPFFFDPQDGDFRTGQPCTIEVSAGRLFLVYWKRFL